MTPLLITEMRLSFLVDLDSGCHAAQCLETSAHRRAPRLGDAGEPAITIETGIIAIQKMVSQPFTRA
jgi:hypothetical protein